MDTPATVKLGDDEFLRTKNAHMASVHPVEYIQKNHAKTQEQLKYTALKNVYGSHMVMRLEMEKQILSSFQRLPVLKSSFAGLDTITKKDLEFGFEDYLGDPFEREDIPKSVHHMMEAKLKL
jgi:hypothetical protein